MTLEQCAENLGVPVKWLWSVIDLESSHNPAAENPYSGAIGLIQWLPAYVFDAFGISPWELRVKTYDEQMDYVYQWLKKYKGRFLSPVDLYLTVFYPAAVGQPNSYKIGMDYGQRARIAAQNPQFDINSDGVIEKREISDWFYGRYPGLKKKMKYGLA